MEVIGISIDLSWETTLKINSLSHPWSDFTTSITTLRSGRRVCYHSATVALLSFQKDVMSLSAIICLFGHYFLQ